MGALLLGLPMAGATPGAPVAGGDEIVTREGETLRGEIAKTTAAGDVVLVTAKGPVLVPAKSIVSQKRAPRAEESKDAPAPSSREARGFEVALRAGYAKSSGKLADEPDAEMSRVLPTSFPVSLEIGGRPVPQLFLGGLFRYSFDKLGAGWDKVCGDGGPVQSCSAYGFGLGGMIGVHFLPRSDIDPWAMASLSFSADQVNGDASGEKLRIAFRGIETRWAVGADKRMTKQIRLGVFVEVARVHYYDAVGKLGDLRIGRGFDETTHTWVSFGPKVSFMP